MEELWGGNTLLWKKNGIKIKENIADFCGFGKCVSENGVEALSIDHVRSATDINGGAYFELFVGNAPYAKRLLELNNKESWYAVCFEKNFYAIRYETISTTASQYAIKSFCKYDENGNVIYRYESAGTMPVDKLKELNPHKHSHYLGGLSGFYVINDTFYLLFSISSTEVNSNKNEDEEDLSMYFLITYKDGSCISQKIISGVKFIDTAANESAVSCKNQFLVDEKILLTGSSVPGPYYENRPLIAVSEGGISRPFSAKYSYIGTNGKDIFLTDARSNYDRRQKIYLFDNGEYKLIHNIENDDGAINHRVVALAFIDNMMYIAANYGDVGFPYSAVVIEVDLNSPEKGTVIYKLNTPKHKYSWIGIRQLTAKNGKLYVHKEWQKLWTDGDKSLLGIDEITFPDKKKGDAT